MSEAALARAVIAQALDDATAADPRGNPVLWNERAPVRERARAWLLRRSTDLDIICAMGGIDAGAVVTLAHQLEDCGWQRG